jgi:phytase-like protein
LHLLIALISLLSLPLSGSCSCAPSDTLMLELERAVWLDSQGALNLSGLALGDDGYLYFSDDNGPAPVGWQLQNPVLLRIRLEDVLDSSNANPRLEALEAAGEENPFEAMAEQGGKAHKFDLEGVAVAGDGKLWTVDERDRLLIEHDTDSGAMRQVAGYGKLASWHEQLASGRINNGFEGIALLEDKLFLANEMFPGLIVRYTLSGTGEIEPDTVFRITGNHDITGLECDSGSLYALGRSASTVYRLDPETGAVAAVASFRREGDLPRYRYAQRMDHYRNSEGLAVGGGRIFIVMDGNFQPCLEKGNQRLPLLLIYRRPNGF